MKTILSLFSLLSVSGLLFFTGCASENDQGGSYGSTESNQGKFVSPHNTPDASDRGDYWGREFDYNRP
jgi:hypothetical protein